MKVFVGGSKHLFALPEDVKKDLNRYINNNVGILVGDCNGADCLMREYLPDADYRNKGYFYVPRR